MIDGLSLDLLPGEALGVLGPNGAGKTTLFNLIAGDLVPSAGRIFLDGRDVTRLPAHARCRLGLGRSYQIPRPFGGMTVFENLLVAATFGGARREAAGHDHCIAVLARTGLLSKANAMAGRLALLDRKRLELARALATGPRVLLLDEIAGGLTESECLQLVALIRAIHAEGVSVIWIEHVVHALLAVVSRLVVLNFGRKLAEGPPLQVMEDPAVQEIYLGIEVA